MIKNMVRTSEPKNQEFHKHNEPQQKIRCFYKKTTCSTYLTCLACKSPGIYPVNCFQQGARTSRFGAKPPAPQYYKVATTLR